MRTTIRISTAGVVMLAMVSFGATACHHHDRRGPAERAGAKVDRAADKTGDAIEHTGKKINHALPGD